MTAATLKRMNVGLALSFPAAVMIYLTLGDAKVLATTAALVALSMVWLTVTAAVNTIPHSRLGLLEGTTGIPERGRLPRVLPAAWATKDVSRPYIPWGWTSILLAPLELLMLASAVPAVVMLVMLPVGLALAGILWVSRVLLHL
jgi:hypothetical protein